MNIILITYLYLFPLILILIFSKFKKKDKKIIDIDQIREMIQFTNQTSFNNERKFIIIEDINLLGINSANALLKSIEEPNNKTYYILINNSEFKILETIKIKMFRI